MSRPMARRDIRSVALTLAVLLVTGAPAAAQSSTGLPLTDAVKAGDIETVRALVGLSADVSVTESDGTTPLHWAAHLDHASQSGAGIG